MPNVQCDLLRWRITGSLVGGVLVVRTRENLSRLHDQMSIGDRGLDIAPFEFHRRQQSSEFVPFAGLVVVTIELFDRLVDRVDCLVQTVDRLGEFAHELVDQAEFVVALGQQTITLLLGHRLLQIDRFEHVRERILVIAVLVADVSEHHVDVSDARGHVSVVRVLFGHLRVDHVRTFEDFEGSFEIVDVLVVGYGSIAVVHRLFFAFDFFFDRVVFVLIRI